ncbi:hypothetical protein L0F63_002079 [Massospora cicadina]|nr:hypothetical protein L0F63_002079 [Massospora cicadina]
MVANPNPKIAIVFYTTYLHIYKLAKAIKEGAEKSGLCEVNLYQVPETLSQEALDKMHAPPKPELPIVTPEILEEADGILFGYPTRYGTLPAQLKDFIDSCGKLWASEDAEMIGGTPWGASVIAGKDGTRQPSAKELEIAHTQGKNFAKTLCRYHNITEKQENSNPDVRKEVSQKTEPLKEHVIMSPETNSVAVPATLPESESGQGAVEKNELQTSPPTSPEKVAATTQVPPPDVSPENKVEATELQRGETSATHADNPNDLGSKDSALGTKSTSGLKKFFKRLSVRSKPSDAN